MRTQILQGTAQQAQDGLNQLIEQYGNSNVWISNSHVTESGLITIFIAVEDNPYPRGREPIEIEPDRPNILDFEGDEF